MIDLQRTIDARLASLQQQLDQKEQQVRLALVAHFWTIYLDCIVDESRATERNPIDLNPPP